jgi:hypothetical protein
VKGTLSMPPQAVFVIKLFSFTDWFSVSIIPSILNASADLKIAPTF